VPHTAPVKREQQASSVMFMTEFTENLGPDLRQMPKSLGRKTFPFLKQAENALKSKKSLA